MEGLTAQLPHVRAGSLRALAVTGRVERRPLAGRADDRRGRCGGLRVRRLDRPGRTGGHAAPDRRAAAQRDRPDRGGHETRQWFGVSGSEAGLQSPQAFTDFIRVEYTRLGQLIRDAGVRAE